MVFTWESTWYWFLAGGGFQYSYGWLGSEIKLIVLMTSYSYRYHIYSTIIEIWIQIIDYNKSNYILPDLQICKRTEKGSMIRCLGHILKGFCKLCYNAHYGLCYIVLSCSSSLRILLSSVQVNVKWNLQSKLSYSSSPRGCNFGSL